MASPENKWLMNAEQNKSLVNVLACNPKNKNSGHRCLNDLIKEHVLPLLPAKSLCKCRLVCKEWNQWISHPFLAHKQTNYFREISGVLCQFPDGWSSFISVNDNTCGIPHSSFYFLPEPVSIITTTNGLVCCQSYGTENLDPAYYVCNPVTKDWQMLPSPQLYHPPETARVLAFEPGLLNFASNFELVCAVKDPTCLDDGFTIVSFEIYSSRSCSWRTCETLCSEPSVFDLIEGFYMNGIVYWRMSSGGFLAFDLRNEQYGTYSLPCSGQTNGSLTHMNGELCFILPQIQDHDLKISVYSGNSNMSLKQVITLDPGVVDCFNDDDCKALPCVDNDMVLILLRRKIVVYYVSTQKTKLLMAEDGFASLYLPYINNLVPVAKSQELDEVE